jgi:plasmid stability protein
MHNACMTVITIRNVPDELNESIKTLAAGAGQSVQQYLLGVLHTQVERSAIEDRLTALLDSIPPANVTTAEIVAAVRAHRDELG